MRAHQRSSDQMKILKDQSAQTTTRAVGIDSGQSSRHLSFFKIAFTLNCLLLCVLGCLTYNIESAIAFAILEK